jgi:hypothetical protein
MQLPFTSNQFIIKRKGLSSDKFRICTPRGELLFYVEEKINWTPPFNVTIRFYDDEKKTREILQAHDCDNDEYTSFLEVIDLTTGEKLGGVGGDWSNFFEDAWGIVDPVGAPVCTIREGSTKRAILHDLTDGLVPQKFHFLVEKESIGELRQKPVFIGAQLIVNFEPTRSSLLDHRLGLVAAVVIAAHQAKTESD